MNNNKIAWTTFTANGFKLVEKDKAILKWKSVDAKYFEDSLSDFGITVLNKTNANLLALVPEKHH